MLLVMRVLSILPLNCKVRCTAGFPAWRAVFFFHAWEITSLTVRLFRFCFRDLQPPIRLCARARTLPLLPQPGRPSRLNSWWPAPRPAVRPRTPDRETLPTTRARRCAR